MYVSRQIVFWAFSMAASIAEKVWPPSFSKARRWAPPSLSAKGGQGSGIRRPYTAWSRGLARDVDTHLEAPPRSRRARSLKGADHGQDSRRVGRVAARGVGAAGCPGARAPRRRQADPLPGRGDSDRG